MSAKLEVSGLRRNRRHHRHHDRRRHHRDDFAVEGIQEAGRELSRRFANLRRRCQARRLVEAIRHCDCRVVNELFEFHCRAIHFFKKPGFDCVRICCTFGRDSAVISFDICVRRRFDECRRHDCGCGRHGFGFDGENRFF
ncbi:hypothetical protein I6N90_12830 [Paenibacillus sp. GSMTC-2017]|uniref:hypothetical protein n=1 Tax=Paenibacillus sp. GSMTC-2017 TaxID=2794350 RepID=UPI0018D5AC7F|nr:hypothetical protein [Paenibacillus sp. GSMTC-2017]MBH5318683.1 hypothetical protein [Paenibacillus sp. GSMTC-2017]